MDIGKIGFCLARCPSSYDFPCDLHGPLRPDQAEGEMLLKGECSNVAKGKRKQIKKRSFRYRLRLANDISTRSKCKRTARDARSRPAAMV